MAMTSEAALGRAIEMEKEGKRFYTESAKKVKSELARKVFEELALEEDWHIRTVEKIFNDLKTEKPLRQWVTAAGEPGHLGKVFEEALVETAKASKVFEEALVETAKASDDDLEALRFGLEMEERSIKYYEGLAGEAQSGFEKRFYLTLSYEERGHYLRIMDSIEYLTDPSGWYYVKQGSMVDGG
jgi:rubrerythrin